MLKVVIEHVSDGHIITRPMDFAPQTGDTIKLGLEYYTVLERIWNFNDARTVNIMVEEKRN
jgi:hypothetical protein